MKLSMIFVFLLCCCFVGGSGPAGNVNNYYDWYTNVWWPYYLEWTAKAAIGVYLYQLMESRKIRLIGACVLEICSKKRYKNKRYWVSPVLEYRNTRGFFNTIFSILHLKYFRTSLSRLEGLVQLVGADIYKITYLREVIPVRQRLVLTLR
ncbi:hypothetical protein QAD02_017668 [Eretmocerus hayati]|uniref:Uncharacterized protein n=1 Tax=Eretmocerus hayati TaxID=131215 RepID=A0ACC2PEH9_9HYME|nr:hypothetical protein QAD02_017668 [Eretmocerus hayati]